MIKRILLTLFLGSLSLLSLYPEDYKTVLGFADSLVNFPDTDFSAEYTIIKDVPGEGKTETVCVIFRRDSAKKYMIIIMEPESSRGQGYLKLNETLWFYDPESRRFNSTSVKDRFQNSNARNSDFTQSTLAEDYNIEKGEKVKLGVFDCRLLHLKANNDDVTYPIMKIWISEDGLVRKTEDYSLSNQLLRTTAVSGYQKVRNKYIPQKILIVDNLAGNVVNGKFVHEKTQITITKPSLKALPDSVFSKAFLENVSR